jgi:hypothetical protein
MASASVCSPWSFKLGVGVLVNVILIVFGGPLAGAGGVLLRLPCLSRVRALFM